MAPQVAQLLFGRIDTGFAVRIDGRGTMHESPVFQAFVHNILIEQQVRVELDLSRCEYLDSTFLGCIVGLYRRFGTDCAPRFALRGVSQRCLKLMAGMGLTDFLHIDENSPTLLDDQWQPVPSVCLDEMQFNVHILDCHRRLAECDGPQQAVFANVADHMARDLAAKNKNTDS